jgi:hypothetical protein
MKMFHIKRVLIPFIIFSNCMIFANTYYVKNDGDDSTSGTSWQTAFKTISHSLEVPESGDDIWVKEGTYKDGKTIIVSEGISLYGGFSGTETDLSQRSFSEHQTIVDGEDSYQCVYNNGHLDGFDIINGFGFHGAGIENWGTMKNCFIHDNQAWDTGGGVYNNDLMTSCAIYNNSALGGGGIYNWELGVVDNCLVSGNHAEKGGGIFNKRGIIRNSIIHSNILWDTGGGSNVGGGICNTGGEVGNCLIYNNTGKDCGGIYNDFLECYGNSPNVTNCTVFGNSSDICGGILNRCIISNCISWNNENLDYSQEEGFPHQQLIFYSCFREASKYLDCITSNPLFLNTEGDISTWDFRLQQDSPCIDAGDPDETYDDGCLPPGMKTLRNDMGAYGGPNNCAWGYYVGRNDIIDFLMGMKNLSPNHFPYADRNKDTMIDISDLIDMIFRNPAP